MGSKSIDGLISIKTVDNQSFTNLAVDAVQSNTLSNLTATNLTATNLTASNITANELITSDFKLPTDAQDGYVLTSDVDGNGTWTFNAAGSNIYNSNGTLTGDRVVSCGGNDFKIANGTNTRIEVIPDTVSLVSDEGIGLIAGTDIGIAANNEIALQSTTLKIGLPSSATGRYLKQTNGGTYDVEWADITPPSSTVSNLLTLTNPTSPYQITADVVSITVNNTSGSTITLYLPQINTTIAQRIVVMSASTSTANIEVKVNPAFTPTQGLTWPYFGTGGSSFPVLAANDYATFEVGYTNTWVGFLSNNFVNTSRTQTIAGNKDFSGTVNFSNVLGISFNDTGLSIRRISAGWMGFHQAGIVRWDYNSTRIGTTIPIYLPNGTAAAPSLTFTNDTGNNSGMYFIANDTFGLSAGGNNVVVFGPTTTTFSNKVICPTFQMTSSPITGGYLASDVSGNATWTAFPSANQLIDHSTVSITAGTGLSGGGDITASRTLSLADTTVSAGSYGSATSVPSITVDAQGRITAASGNTIPDWTSTTLNLSTSGTITGSQLISASNGTQTEPTFKVGTSGVYQSSAGTLAFSAGGTQVMTLTGGPGNIAISRPISNAAQGSASGVLYSVNGSSSTGLYGLVGGGCALAGVGVQAASFTSTTSSLTNTNISMTASGTLTIDIPSKANGAVLTTDAAGVCTYQIPKSYFAGFEIVNNVTTTAVGTANTFVKATVTGSNLYVNDSNWSRGSPAVQNRVVFLGVANGRFIRIIGNVSVRGSVNNQNLVATIYKNGSAISGNPSEILQANGTVIGNIPIMALTTVSTNDFFEIYVANKSGNQVLTVTQANLLFELGYI